MQNILLHEHRNQKSLKKTGKSTHLWTLSTTLLTNASKKKTREIRKYLEKNGNRNTAHQTLWNTTKAVLRQKLRVVNTYIKKLRSQIKTLTLQPKNQEKVNPKLPVE